MRAQSARGAVVLCALLGLFARPSFAQTPDSVPVPTGRFLGHIISSIDSTPVRTADVRLLFVDSSRTVRTKRGDDSLEVFIDSTKTRLVVSDSTGGFIIRRLQEGKYLLQIRRIGFAPLEGVLSADTGAVGDVFSMAPTSRLLAKVVITEMSVDRVKRKLDRVGFTDRTHSGSSGTFVDRAEIVKLNRERLEDLLSRYGIHSGDVMMDRMPLDYEDVRDYPSDLVLGIEIYRHGRPTDFTRNQARTDCLEHWRPVVRRTSADRRVDLHSLRSPQRLPGSPHRP